jgi:hypothetical protein
MKVTKEMPGRIRKNVLFYHHNIMCPSVDKTSSTLTPYYSLDIWYLQMFPPVLFRNLSKLQFLLMRKEL